MSSHDVPRHPALEHQCARLGFESTHARTQGGGKFSWDGRAPFTYSLGAVTASAISRLIRPHHRTEAGGSRTGSPIGSRDHALCCTLLGARVMASGVWCLSGHNVAAVGTQSLADVEITAGVRGEQYDGRCHLVDGSEPAQRQLFALDSLPVLTDAC